MYKNKLYNSSMELLAFDLDGVIVDAKNIHYESLNDALPEEYTISWKEHLSIFDGLKTNQKLEILSEKKGLPKNLYEEIWEKKQQNTILKLESLKKDEKLISLLSKLKSMGFKLAVCSNSIKKTVEIVLKKKGINDFFDLVLSNEDVDNAKPHPEIYWKAMTHFGVLPSNTLIIEDSPYGLTAATNSNANICRVKSADDVSLNKIEPYLYSHKKITHKWEDKKMNVLIPMAGAGSRFQEAGYTFPKPLIEVNGKPMIQVVVENLNIDANYIFVVQKEHREKYKLDSMLNLICDKPKIVEVDGLTEGAACTALLAKDYINSEEPLFFANSDQFVEWSSTDFFYKMSETESDGGIVTFKATHPKWSFAKVDDEEFVTEVAEKNPISDNATVGFYYWKHGCNFVKYAEQMINKDIRVNNEFYVCPVFNEAIEDDLKIKNFEISRMWGLGTPEDLEFFVKNYNQ